MSWIAMRGSDRLPVRAGAAPDNALIEDGSLLLELDLAPSAGPRVLLDSCGPGDAGLALWIEETGEIVLRQWRGSDSRRFVLRAGPVAGALRGLLTLVWDARRGLNRWQLETVETGRRVWGHLPDAIALTHGEASALCAGPLERGVTWIAVADHAVPLGPLPSLDGGTPVRTARGVQPLASLRAGQSVVTADGRTAQVRWCGRVTLPALGVLAPVRLLAPYHGAMRDLVCAGWQALRLGNPAVEYMFGTEAVAARIGDLSSGTRVERSVGPTVEYWQVLLDRPGHLTVGGLDLSTFDAAALEDAHLRAVSLLAALPPELLPPGAHRLPLLQRYETRTLCGLLAA